MGQGHFKLGLQQNHGVLRWLDDAHAGCNTNRRSYWDHQLDGDVDRHIWRDRNKNIYGKLRTRNNHNLYPTASADKRSVCYAAANSSDTAGYCY